MSREVTDADKAKAHRCQLGVCKQRVAFPVTVGFVAKSRTVWLCRFHTMLVLDHIREREAIDY